MSSQNEVVDYSFMNAIDYFEEIIAQRLEDEGFPINTNIRRREALTAFMLEHMKKYENKITEYTKMHPERLSVDVEVLYDGARDAVLKAIREEKNIQQPSVDDFNG